MLGVARVFAKSETLRLGLPAFKALGASWAVNRAIEKYGKDITLVTATDGNHGRAIAKYARLAKLPAVIFVPEGIHPKAVAAIKAELATVIEVADVYDQAVSRAAEFANQPKHVLIQDTAWQDYEEIPNWIVQGYETLFTELDLQLEAAGVEGSWLLTVPTGVGSLLQASLQHYRSTLASSDVAVVSVEPQSAACVFESLKAKTPVSVKTSQTMMAGLNCGTVSSIAWPVIEKGIDGAVAISETEASLALTELRQLGIDAGPCAAAGLASLKLLAASSQARKHLAINEKSIMVFLLTESAEANPFA